MTLARVSGGILAAVAVVLVLAGSGCGPTNQEGGQVHRKEAPVRGGDKKEDGHGWWCQEHGIPERLCSQCQADVAAKCKQEGDWCPLHDRAKSQCFKCDPSLYRRFEAMYVAKFGAKPEPPPHSEFEK